VREKREEFAPPKPERLASVDVETKGAGRAQPCATTWVGRKVTVVRPSSGPGNDAKSVP
jgi:hypothetical protein